ILHLIQHLAEQEKSEHPLQRIMAIEKTAQGSLITTTDIHLARGIGEALHHAYQGELEFHYNPEQLLLRVNWVR
ncbi:MAG: ATPase, partial [Gallionellales bacterium CG_4_10_14_3_um_filter_54_96]